MIAEDSLRRVRELPIEQVAHHLGLSVRGHRSLCPFHDDSHPSLTFNVRRCSYRCYVCDAHGGTIDLAMHMLNLPFAEAAREVARAFGISLHETHPSPAAYGVRNTHSVHYTKAGLEGLEAERVRSAQRLRGGHAAVASEEVMTGQASFEAEESLMAEGALEAEGAEAGDAAVASEGVMTAQRLQRTESSLTVHSSLEAEGVMRASGGARYDAGVYGTAGAWAGRGGMTEPQADVRHLEQIISPPLLNEEARQFLFDERKIHPQVVRWLGLSSISSPVPMSSDYRSSWFNAPSLLIPYRDTDGRLLSVQARYLGPKPGDEESLHRNRPRFQFPKGSHCRVFNLPVLQLLGEGESLWITEGVTDCLAMLSSGRKAIAIPSATLLTQEDVQLLRLLHHRLGTCFHICPDQDAAGARLFLELSDRLPNLTHHLLPPDCKDFGQWWAERGDKPKVSDEENRQQMN